jgi:hypothetical protein
MKRTIEIETWSAADLAFLPGKTGEDSCTVQQLVEFLLKQTRRPEITALDNVRLTIQYGDDWDISWLVLVGDREETDDERRDRETKQTTKERRILLDYIVEHYRPRLRNENDAKYQHDCAVLIQQKGWDKLDLRELRRLVKQIDA